MGRERSVKLAQGVRIRDYASGIRSIEIQFQYRGVQCKETLSSLDPGVFQDSCRLKFKIMPPRSSRSLG